MVNVVSQLSNCPCKAGHPCPECERKQRMYSIIHTVAFLVALYLYFSKNNTELHPSLLVVCCCPYLYIIYALAQSQGLVGGMSF